MSENKTTVRAIYADTDAMGVVYHTNYIKWFEVGRSELLRSMGYPYARMEEEGVMLPVVECSCRYILPAVYDDLLEITARIAEMRGVTITLNYEIRRKYTDELLVTGWTKHAITDLKFRPIRLRNSNRELYDSLMK
ncbi:MAG: thioesterase family protein [Eubacteriales bacterium]|nr:thioesterase family protein [Eubacteriales bacterium]MDD3200120.1 thioesterase family protein [Eubacteriales bacterium]MDD4630369.1 thioesterase family protein [Eubacteriales bacterium]